MTNVLVTQKITVTIGSKSHELSLEDARQLRNELNKAIASEPVAVQQWPYAPYYPWFEHGRTISTDKITVDDYRMTWMANQ